MAGLPRWAPRSPSRIRSPSCSRFVAAPIGTLNPFGKIGLFTGVAEAFLRKPRVKDVENLAGGRGELPRVLHQQGHPHPHRLFPFHARCGHREHDHHPLVADDALQLREVGRRDGSGTQYNPLHDNELSCSLDAITGSSGSSQEPATSCMDGVSRFRWNIAYAIATSRECHDFFPHVVDISTKYVYHICVKPKNTVSGRIVSYTAKEIEDLQRFGSHSGEVKGMYGQARASDLYRFVKVPYQTFASWLSVGFLGDV